MSLPKDKHIIVLFFLLYLLVVLAFGLVVRRIVIIQGKEKIGWLHLSDSLNRAYNDTTEIQPARGNIYSDANKLLVTTVPEYKLVMDFETLYARDTVLLADNRRLQKRIDQEQKKRHRDTAQINSWQRRIKKNRQMLFENQRDSLVLCLVKKFGNKGKTREQYVDFFRKGYKKRLRNGSDTWLFNKVSYTDLQEIKTFPVFREGQFKSGLIPEQLSDNRHAPYGSLAVAILGVKSTEKRGIEAAFDSYLAGTKGKGHTTKRAGERIIEYDIKPENGADVYSTLNIDMQDIAEKVLRNKLIELNAENGCVLLMEVKTGAVKVCVNLIKTGDSSYIELSNGNLALRSEIAPGSTFKVPTLIAAFEDKVVDINDTIDCQEGVWKYQDKEVNDLNKISRTPRVKGKISVSDVIIRSSNVGIAKLIVKGYEKNPQQFVNTLHRMCVDKPDIDNGFTGAMKAEILGPKEKKARKKNNPKLKSWSPVDLPVMSYGYSVNMPMFYTLRFFNAIANDGCMVEPQFVHEIKRNDEVIKTFPPKVVNPAICSQKTLSYIREMMLRVVEDTEHGTGKSARSKFVRIAGKTGTSEYDGKDKNRVSFCGFYPYEKPQYTCLVFIELPKQAGAASGGSMAGPVFKEIAERAMAMTTKLSIDDYSVDSLHEKYPSKMIGNTSELKFLLKKLNFNIEGKVPNDKFASVRRDSMGVFEWLPVNYSQNTVPSLRGMGLKDALYVAEKAGLRVNVQGRGKVNAQSLRAGDSFQKGQTIQLILK
ncbi:MAG: PASTA domain-containing protein [Prevotellaceae bacterium]|jgi:cell division protein FtsI (penicillin-binding protein 3)|nr:PASTA domain-containing protein [Prevotellaceae bacterium]